MDKSDDIGGSRSTHVSPQHDGMFVSRGLERRGVTDTKRTILSRDKNHTLDPNVEPDALMSSEPDERGCFQPNNPTGYPPPKTKDDTFGSGLQETTDTAYYTRTAGVGRPSAGETVMLMSTGTTGNWNNTVVLPVDDQRTSGVHQSPPLLAALSPQTQISGGEYNAVAGVIRENTRLREINKHQAEKIHHLTTELARIRDVPRLSSDESSIVHLLNEQIATYKEDFDNERRDKERALSEKDSLMKQTTTLLNDLKALQERNSQLEAALRIARQNMSSDDAERRRSPSRWAD